MPTNKYFLIAIFLFVATQIFAQITPSSTVSIPMRDGKILKGDLYLPNNTDSFSTILIQTPYNKNNFRLTGLPAGVKYNIANSPYAFLVVDWRCYFQSAAACVATVNSGQDGYDAVEWIAQQSWSNGKVGTWGPSALSVIQFQTAKEQPPHLVCGVPVVTAPQTYYNKYFEGGALRIDYFDFVSTYFGLNNIILDNPYYNNLWAYAETNSTYPQDIEVPMFIVGGWFDINVDDCFNMFNLLKTSSATGVRNKHRLLMGPWSHSEIDNANQGDLMYNNAAGLADSLTRMYFDYHLENVNNGWENTPFVQYYQMGTNELKSNDVWPPNEVSNDTFFFHNNNILSPLAPTNTTNDFLSFVYNPQNPSPSIGGKYFETHFVNTNVGPIDQRDSVESRNDNIIYTSEPLTEDVVVQGKIKAKIYFSSDRKDTDLSLRITDVYPDGRSIIFAESHYRLRFRNGFTIADTAFMTPNSVYEVEMETENLGLTFLEGHRIRVIVTSSNYPRFNRNMNTGEEMYPNYNIDTLVNPLIATNNIHSSSSYPSSIILPVNKTNDTTGTAINNLYLDDKMELSVYPVPSSNFIYIDKLLPWQKMELYYISGKMVWNNSVGGYQPNYKIDVSNFNKGSYILKVIGKNHEIGVAKVMVN